MTTEASDTKELAFKDLRPGQAIYLRTTKDVAKLFSTNDTIQGFQILMVTNEDLKEAGLPVTRRRLTVKSMVDENLWEINVIPETTMVITPTSTGVVDPHILDGLRKGISPSKNLLTSLPVLTSCSSHSGCHYHFLVHIVHKSNPSRQFSSL